MVVDAFSGDAIPTHLLTREALEVYRRRLAPNGIMAFHVSNTYLRLAPIVRRLASECGMLATRIDHSPTQDEERQLVSPSTWVVTRDGVRANPSEPPDSAGRQSEGAALDGPIQQRVPNPQEPLTVNLILRTDSYKFTHWKQYPFHTSVHYRQPTDTRKNSGEDSYCHPSGTRATAGR